MTHKVLIAEDHIVVSQGLEVMLSMADDVELVGVVTSGEAAVESVSQQKIDVILMDVNFGKGINGIEAARRVKKVSPDTRILMLTMFTDPATVAEAVKAGADGYLSKGTSRDSLLTAIRQVLTGRSVLDPNVTRGIFGQLGGPGAKAFTERELLVLQQLAYGRSTKEIAKEIHVSEETVKTYLKTVYRKLDVRDRVEAVAEAFRRGLVH